VSMLWANRWTVLLLLAALVLLTASVVVPR
jgi:hypothetical protein